LGPVLDIFQQSFPLSEQMPFSWWLGFLSERQHGAGARRHLVSWNEAGEVAAFAYYEEHEAADYLWYLATRPERRNSGVGARLLQELLRRTFERGRALLFEVELPEMAALISTEDEEWARRRIAWYRRHGARLLGGIEYLQDVGWQPSHPMGLMLIANTELSPDDALGIAAALFGKDIRQVGQLALT
jgi:GNAT superfamily N-acetyltransferase